MIYLCDAIYLLVGVLGGPFYLLSRLLKRKGMASPWKRLGFVEGSAKADQAAAGSAPLVWIHGVSVGEVLAARGLISELQQRSPTPRIVITSTTVTGLSVAREAYPSCTVLENPFDLSFAIRNFLGRVQPTLLILMEGELWPNMLAITQKAQVPVLVANGKVSPGSAKGYRRLGKVLRGWLDGVEFCMQGREGAERIASLGVEASRIHTTGNLKFDAAELRSREAVAALRAELRVAHGFASDTPILVAGSTHPGEEQIILQAFVQLRKTQPEAKLVLAPRHPERVPQVVAMLEEAKIPWGPRSRPGERPNPPCLLVDTMGELSTLYGVADVAFVGGTLVPIGGHNLLEPAALGLPLVVGEYLRTVRGTAQLFEAAGILRRVASSEELAAVASQWMDNPAARARIAAASSEVISTHRGAVRRTLSVASRHLDG